MEEQHLNSDLIKMGRPLQEVEEKGQEWTQATGEKGAVLLQAMLLVILTQHQSHMQTMTAFTASRDGVTVATTATLNISITIAAKLVGKLE